MATKKNISKRITDIIATATPKQKAILVCRDYTDKGKLRVEPLLTEDEVDAIRNSLTPEEGREYNKWIRCYNVYAELTPIIGLAVAQFREQANEIAGYLQVSESYEQEENHLNAIFEDLKGIGNKKALETYADSLSHLHFKYGAKLIRDEEGYIEIQTEQLFKMIQGLIKDMGFSYRLLKAFIIALDNWTTKKKSKKLMPETLSEPVEQVKSDTLINIPPTYSRKHLQARIASGHTPTPYEQSRAIFPCYADIPEDEEFLGVWTRKILSIENSLNNG